MPAKKARKDEQLYYHVQPDLSTFAKAIGGGLSVALVGGKREVMDMFNPVGPVVSQRFKRCLPFM